MVYDRRRKRDVVLSFLPRLAQKVVERKVGRIANCPTWTSRPLPLVEHQPHPDHSSSHTTCHTSTPPATVSVAGACFRHLFPKPHFFASPVVEAVTTSTVVLRFLNNSSISIAAPNKFGKTCCKDPTTLNSATRVPKCPSVSFNPSCPFPGCEVCDTAQHRDNGN